MDVLNGLIFLGSLGAGILTLAIHGRYKKHIVEGFMEVDILEEYKKVFQFTSILYITIIALVLLVNGETTDTFTMFLLLFAMGYSVFEMVSLLKKEVIPRRDTFTMFWNGVLLLFFAFLYLIY